MKNNSLKYCLTLVFLLLLNSHYTQNEIDTAAFEARLLEQSKGAPKEDVEALKKKVKKIKIVVYKGMSTLIYSNPDGIKKSDFEDSQILKGGIRIKLLIWFTQIRLIMCKASVIIQEMR